MTRFQAFAVDTPRGPVVTMQAGVELAGRYFATTSHTAAKARSVRRAGVAAVLDRTDTGWSLRMGRAVVLDPRHPLDASRDPIGAMWSGAAFAKIAATYPEQLVGYATDRRVPMSWSFAARVLLAVRGDRWHEWTDHGVVTRGPAPSPPRWPLEPRATGSAPTLDAPHDALVARRGPCWLGVLTPHGPAVVPATWTHGGIVRAHTAVLSAIGARLPGPGCVTIDDSESNRPSGKTGVILRGSLTPRTNRSGTTALAVRVDTTTTWVGFASTPHR